jgi:YVTN family beta-propeller protein
MQKMRKVGVVALAVLLLSVGCHRGRFPDVPPGYSEFAYITNGASNTVSVLDLVYLRADRTLQVGLQPTGLAVNPKRDEVYVVNTGTAAGMGSVSVIDTDANRVVATIPLHKLPYFIDVDAAGERAYVANSGSNTVSVIDLDRRRVIGVVGTGEQPGLARISRDMRSLVVTNRGGGSVSIFSVEPYAAAEGAGASGETSTQKIAAKEELPRLRAVFTGCPGATDAVILDDSSKAFVACSGGHQVMAVSLAGEAERNTADRSHAGADGRGADAGATGAEAGPGRDLLRQLRIGFGERDRDRDERGGRDVHHREQAGVRRCERGQRDAVGV